MVILAAGLSLSGGCTVVPSEDVKTSGMWAHFIAEHHPSDTVVVLAVLRVGGQLGTIIDLTGEDQMECNGTRMTEYVEQFTQMHWTGAELSPDPSGDYVFSFIRADEQVNTTVSTPEIPTIIDTTPAVDVGVDDEIIVTWDASGPGDHVNLFVYGTCINDKWIYNQEDDGSYQMPALEDQNPQNPTDCTIGLQIRRIFLGDVAQDFKDGYTEGKGIDAVTLNYQ
jgi:hypothetical protein